MMKTIMLSAIEQSKQSNIKQKSETFQAFHHASNAKTRSSCLNYIPG